MNGMDIYTLSKILGHSSVTVTEQAYLDLTDEDIGKRYQNFSPYATMKYWLYNKKEVRNIQVPYIFYTILY